MKQRLFIFYYFILAFLSQAQGPSLQWAKSFGGTGNGIGYAITTDVLGNVYSTGWFNGTSDFDPGPGTFTLTAIGNCDIFISKLDASGNFVWAKNIGGPSTGGMGYSIAIDAAGNVYTTGHFQNTIDFDPGAGTFNLTSIGSAYDIFISKLDASGNFVWAKNIERNLYSIELSVTVDPSNDVCVSGSFQGTSDFDPGAGVFNLTSSGDDDIFIMKLDAAGNLMWAKKIGGTSSDRGTSVAADASGNIYTTGSFVNTVDFDPGAGAFNLTSGGGRDIFISKLDASGNFVWAKNMGGNLNEEGFAIAINASGNVYTTGFFSGTSDFDPGAGTYNLTSGNYCNIFVSKLDAAGNFVWAKSMCVNPYYYWSVLKVDISGSVYLAGYFEGTVDFDPTAGVFNLTSAGLQDIFISKLDDSGDFVWAKKIGGTSEDRGYSVAIDLYGNVYTTGYFEGTVDFDPGPGTFNLISPGNADIFIHKMSQCSEFTTNASSQSYSCTGSATVTANGAGPFIFSWNPSGGNSPIASNLSPGIYSCVVTNYTCGAIITQTVNITSLLPSPTITVNGSNILICTGQSVTLTANGANNYLWNTAATSSSIVVSPISNSTYTVIGINPNGCFNTQTITIDVNVCTIVSNASASWLSDIKLYPNPLSEILNVELGTTYGRTTSIQLINSLGEIVLNEKLETNHSLFDISNLPDGLYFVTLKQNGSIKTFKIVKE